MQIDDGYLSGKPGRESENKQPFVIAVSTDSTLEPPTFAVIELVRGFDNDALRDCAARRLAPDAEAYTDGLACFRRIEEAGHAHTVPVTGGGSAATQTQCARWVNVLLANVKRAISGCYHAIRQPKYARRYLAEAAHCKPYAVSSRLATGNFHGSASSLIRISVAKTIQRR